MKGKKLVVEAITQRRRGYKNIEKISTMTNVLKMNASYSLNLQNVVTKVAKYKVREHDISVE
jgi:hypothetical protein